MAALVGGYGVDSRRTGTGACASVVLFLIVAVFAALPTQAAATPGAIHVAFGEGVKNSPCGGISFLICTRVDSLRIDATDAVGPVGNATYQCASQFDFPCDGSFPGQTREIALSCVVIQDIAGGHELFASGEDQNGAQAYIFLRVISGQTPAFHVSSDSSGGPCQAPTAVPPPGPFEPNPTTAGVFTIEPAPSSPLEADLAVTKTDSADPVLQGDPLSYTVTVTNNGPEQATFVRLRDDLPVETTFESATPSQGSCSHSAGELFCDIGSLASGETATVGIDVTAHDAGTMTNGATATANETDPNNADNTDLESTEVQTLGYARPKAATPISFSLVPAFEACESPNASHGSPLSVPSCNPPVPTASRVTVGTPDANGKAANFTGSLNLKVIGESPIDGTNGDQADILITAQLTDVRNKSDLSDHVGGLRADLTWRITDRYNGANRRTSATVTDFPHSSYFFCHPTDDPTIGSSCNLSTSVDTYTGGVVVEGQRSVWELAQVEVYDLDGGDLLAVQGLFAP